MITWRHVSRCPCPSLPLESPWDIGRRRGGWGFCSEGAEPDRLLRGPEPPQGRVSGPNSGDRLCFYIENRIRVGFSLVIGLTFHEGLCHSHKGLPERAIAGVELRSLIEGQGRPVGVD